MFVESGLGDKAWRHVASVADLELPLANLFLEVTSSRFAWVVDLTLSDVYCSPIDLRQLAAIDNIQSLRVRYSRGTTNDQGPFDDRVLINLANRAASEGSLSRLQMIFVVNARGISTQCFEHLGRFPVLDTFCVVGTGIKSSHNDQAKNHGWCAGLDG